MIDFINFPAKSPYGVAEAIRLRGAVRLIARGIPKRRALLEGYLIE
jgi:hypothetical protein